MPFRAVWPIALLVVFFAGIRGLSERRPASVAPLTCNRVEGADIAQLKECLAVHPNDVGLLSDSGGAYEMAGQWETAAGLYRRALAVDPEDGRLRLKLGAALLRTGDRAAAAREARAALRTLPRSPAALALLDRASDAAGAIR